MILKAIVLVAAIALIKNPSEADAKELIRDVTSAKLYSRPSAFSRYVDQTVNIDIHDYVLFSSFSVKRRDDEQKRNLFAGVILFGKAITLSSEVGPEYL